MQVGIVGLPSSGKTTVFNALTRGKAEVVYGAGQDRPNLGVAKVPDRRLNRLAEIYDPRKVVAAEVGYVDIPVAHDGPSGSEGIAGRYLNELQGADAVLVVSRAFEDSAVPHPQNTVDPFRDVETAMMELTLADMGILERRQGRLDEGSKGASASERDAIVKEQTLLAGLEAALEDGVAIRDRSVTADEARALEGFGLLTAKPAIVVANVGEEQLGDVATIEDRLSSLDGLGPRVRTAAFCGQLEMELAQMEPEEEAEFRESLGAGESGLHRMITLSQGAADLITFFTGNDNEVRAWTVPKGTTALKAAGKVHSDFERGFIRAEVVAFDALTECGSLAEARRRGLLRQEGRDYAVKDGDVVNVLFSV